MIVTAEKTAERPAIIAIRDDGVSLVIRAPDRKFSPPHDLVHFVVEKTMRLHRGFWGSVADGAKFTSMEVIDGRQRPHANERSAQVIAANASHLSDAERIVGVFQKVLHEDLKPYDNALRRLFRTGGIKVEAALVQPTWINLVTFRDQWAELPKSEILRLHWRH
jgi:hypothetical protein